MTKHEFVAWATHTDRSRRGWQRDDVLWHNRGTLLLYRGGEQGLYILVEQATVTVGSYRGAIPHIGEAMFDVGGRRAFASESAAYRAVLSAT